MQTTVPVTITTQTTNKTIIIITTTSATSTTISKNYKVKSNIIKFLFKVSNEKRFSFVCSSLLTYTNTRIYIHTCIHTYLYRQTYVYICIERYRHLSYCVQQKQGHPKPKKQYTHTCRKKKKKEKRGEEKKTNSNKNKLQAEAQKSSLFAFASRLTFLLNVHGLLRWFVSLFVHDSNNKKWLEAVSYQTRTAAFILRLLEPSQ